MAAKKPSRRKKKPAEYRFRIDAFSPETIPMVRLAAYLQELAMLLGEPAAVHFDRLEGGSTVAVARIEHEAEPKVRERVAAVERGTAPRDAARSFRALNELLRSDNASGVLQESGRKGVALPFPGVAEKVETFPSIRQQGSVEGILVRVGGVDNTIPVHLEVDGQAITGCQADRRLAKSLAMELFEPVRLHGVGRWSRDADGVWCLKEFKIQTFEKLDPLPLGAAVSALRSLNAPWSGGPLEEDSPPSGKPTSRAHGSH